MNIYSRLVDLADYYDMCCGEQRFLCPDCDTPLCVFCEGECAGCGESIF